MAAFMVLLPATGLGLASAAFGLADNSPYTFITIAGNLFEGSADGTNSEAEFKVPYGVAVDGTGNLYVADQGNSTIRKITPSISGEQTNWVVSAIAGLAGSLGGTDGTNNGARFSSPVGIALDSAGKIYVADQGNSTIRLITPSGTNWIVTTVAGLAGISGTNDGTSAMARFKVPYGIAVASTSTLYVTDTDNSTIRRIALSGTNWVVSTIAGSVGSFGDVDGTNGAARFNYPVGITRDGAGNLYVADDGNQTIRTITPSGTNWVVKTIAGLPGFYGSADGTACAARFDGPAGIAVDGAANVYVGDSDNDLIRMGEASGPYSVTIDQVHASGQNMIVQIQSVHGGTYQLQVNDTITSAVWTNSGASQLGNCGSLTFTDPGGATNLPARFYRVQVTPP